MKWAKPPLSCRTQSHLGSRLYLRDEQAFFYRLFPTIAPVYIIFGFVDCIAGNAREWPLYFSLRLAAVLLSRALFVFARGRLRYGCRLFLTCAPYAYAIEYLIVRNHLLLTPYFAGLGLVTLCATMLFPVGYAFAAVLNLAYIFPLLAWIGFFPPADHLAGAQAALMVIGAAILGTLNSGQIHSDLRHGLNASELLARDLGKRDREIQAKAGELLKRQIFESQFSPQVVSSLLSDRSLTRRMTRSEISIVVIDIQDSTARANSLDPGNYKAVIEEVLDVFSASCLKWDVTLDKFTGDGVQAFAGAPVQSPNDFSKAIMACKDTIDMLRARKESLEVLWKGPLNVRFAVCDGEALVGFIGRGIFKSFTAVGNVVSFTHRLSSVPKPWRIAAYAWGKPFSPQITHPGFRSSTVTVNNIKGFGTQEFRVSILTPEMDSQLVDVGRCRECETPLVVEETSSGLPRVYCPGCVSTASRRAA